MVMYDLRCIKCDKVEEVSMSIKHTEIVPCPICDGPRTIVIGNTELALEWEVKDAKRYIGERNMDLHSPDLYQKMKNGISKIDRPVRTFKDFKREKKKYE